MTLMPLFLFLSGKRMTKIAYFEGLMPLSLFFNQHRAMI